MHRLLNVLVILATLGAALMVFDQVRAFGASILTSAGILGLVAGIAAQRTLQNVFAGLQLAITEPIALGDVIEVENAVGTIEEINLSFVSVRLRDLRRLILPVTYFLEKPLTNWTRTSSESLVSFHWSYPWMLRSQQYACKWKPFCMPMRFGAVASGKS